MDRNMQYRRGRTRLHRNTVFNMECCRHVSYYCSYCTNFFKCLCHSFASFVQIIAVHLFKLVLEIAQDIFLPFQDCGKTKDCHFVLLLQQSLSRDWKDFFYMRVKLWEAVCNTCACARGLYINLKSWNSTF